MATTPKTREEWMTYFNKFGEGLLHALGFTGCERAYGQMFTIWFNTERRVIA